ncbi:MAG: response regulator transcription factor [Lachnospiraceae bacterium]|nr:response regulator transcription factor [Lachnospiraceae bacterium]
MENGRILLVEDDSTLSFIVKRYLESKEYSVTTAESVQRARDEMQKQSFDLVLLDMMLPDGVGTDVCAYIRRTSFCPIIFMSCLNDKETKLRAFEMGGDDYITKPVDFDELTMRIQANIRREHQYNLGRSTSAEEHYGGLVIRRKSHEVFFEGENEEIGEAIDLSPTEYKLLLAMMDKPGELFLYHELYRTVWDADDLGDSSIVMVHISNLKKKLGETGKTLIRTVRGAGYIFGT